MKKRRKVKSCWCSWGSHAQHSRLLLSTLMDFKTSRSNAPHSQGGVPSGYNQRLHTSIFVKQDTERNQTMILHNTGANPVNCRQYPYRTRNVRRCRSKSCRECARRLREWMSKLTFVLSPMCFTMTGALALLNFGFKVRLLSVFIHQKCCHPCVGLPSGGLSNSLSLHLYQTSYFQHSRIHGPDGVSRVHRNADLELAAPRCQFPPRSICVSLSHPQGERLSVGLKHRRLSRWKDHLVGQTILLQLAQIDSTAGKIQLPIPTYMSLKHDTEAKKATLHIPDRTERKHREMWGELLPAFRSYQS
jgi:hypothetical protein